MIESGQVMDVDQGCEQNNFFGWADYSVLAVLLFVSTAIGLFYSCSGPRQRTSEDFLLGGSSMGTVPMSLSLAASFITAIELLGNPAEMYLHGTQFWMTCVAFLVVVPVTSYLFLPVYRNLNVTSAYEYLELRFSSHARTVAALFYVLQMSLYTSVAVYAPAVALSRVTGLNTYLAVTCVYAICVLYASQGGMKAVMMTDTFQAVVLVVSLLVVLALGHYLQGGPSKVWAPSEDTGRLEFFIMDANPTVRHTFWSVVVGGSFYWTSMFCTNQASVQKYMSVKTLGQARIALWVSCFGLILIFTINFYTGMIMYAAYKDCDPVKSQVVSGVDELLPLFVMNSFGRWKGIAGIFVAGIFNASLGTVAAALNSLVAVTMKDFIQGVCGIQLPEHRGARTGRCVSLIFGVLSFGLVFVVEQLGSVLQVAVSFNGMVGGVTLGMFSLGMFFPWANTKGVIIGASTAMALVLWIGVGSQVALAKGSIVELTKFTSTAACMCRNLTDTPPAAHVDPASEADSSTVFVLYRLSYLWYSLLGCAATVIVGLLVSLVTGPQDPREIDPMLLSPPVSKLLRILSLNFKECLSFTSKKPMKECKGVSNPVFGLEDEKPSYEEQTKF